MNCAIRWIPLAVGLLFLSGCTQEAAKPKAEASQNQADPKVVAQEQPTEPAATPAEPPAIEPPAIERLAVEHLPNALRIHPKVISGGLPEGDAAFAELKELGIKTVISVDGARPDVGIATKYGMRYVHLPHGYDGIPDRRMQELAKAVRDFEGPIYIHCHHGKHRSPAAAAAACIGAGLVPPESALAILTTAGTSESYRGLYESATSARQFEQQLLDELEAEFPETAKLPALAEAMVGLEHTFDHMKQIAAAGWKTPPAHPALDPAHEALLLREHFTELLRLESTPGYGERFAEMLRASEAAGEKLTEGLQAWNPAQPPVPAAIPAAMETITKNCTACHREFRDVPLREKLGQR